MSDDQKLYAVETNAIFHLRRFTKQVLHGSDEHKEWLTKSVENYINGLPLDHNNPYKK